MLVMPHPSKSSRESATCRLLRAGLLRTSMPGAQGHGRRLLAAPPWPYFTPEQAIHSQAAWEELPIAGRGCDGAAAPQSRHTSVPAVVHQPWLHGGALRWEHILGMLSVRYVLKPTRYRLYFDRTPTTSPTWRCACLIAHCVQHSAPTRVPGRPGQRLKMYHWPDVMRLQLLLRHGGIFVDHDAFVVKPLDDLRQCAAAPVIAGFEQVSAIETERKLNPGVLLAAPNATMLRLMLASWGHNYSTAWDWNCCSRSYAVHQANPGLAQVRADLGPLPRFRTKQEYQAHLRRARVVHATALSHRWRRQELRASGVLRAVRDIVLAAANTSVGESAELKACAARVSAYMDHTF